MKSLNKLPINRGGSVTARQTEQLQRKIELARIELDRSIVEDDFDVYYQKNLKLDKLIEEYIELQESQITLQFTPLPD